MDSTVSLTVSVAWIPSVVIASCQQGHHEHDMQFRPCSSKAEAFFNLVECVFSFQANGLFWSVVSCPRLPSTTDVRSLCPARSFIFKAIAYVNEARLTGEPHLAPPRCTACLIMASDKQLSGDVLPVDSRGDSRSVYN